MNRYRDQNSLMSTATVAIPNPSVEPVPVARSQPLPTWFKVEHSVYEKRPSHSFTVEAEYRKYISGDISSEGTDILRFWEVRFLYFNGLGATTHSMNRPIKMSS
jgi:hypothetical protein